MERRTQKEIENDFKLIKEAANKAKTMAELSEITGLTYMKIRTCLSNHPIVEKKIKEQIKSNAVTFKAKGQNNKEREFVEPETQKETIFKYVIDASITGTKDIRNILEKICSIKDAKIILTSITIKELHDIEIYPKLHKIPRNIQSADASYIFNLAIEKSEKFEMIPIDENVGIPDDCIIKYCADNKGNLILLTADKEMCLKARMFGVQTEYLKKEISDNKETNSQVLPKEKGGRYKAQTLYNIEFYGKDMVIKLNQTSYKSTCVYSNGKKYTVGAIKLKKGDDVFVSTNKNEYLTFAHYRITALEKENNCELIYFTRIYNKKDTYALPNSFYKSFMNDFLNKNNL